MFLAPLWSGPAHVVNFGPVRVKQARCLPLPPLCRGMRDGCWRRCAGSCSTDDDDLHDCSSTEDNQGQLTFTLGELPNHAARFVMRSTAPGIVAAPSGHAPIPGGITFAPAPGILFRFEIGWAVGLKYTIGFSRWAPTHLTVVSMIVSLTLPGLSYLITVRGGTMRGLGRFAQCQRRILSMALP